MGGKNDTALQRVVLDDVTDEQIVAALRSLVTDQDAVGIARDEVAGDDRIDRSDQVKRATAVTSFIGLINSVAGLIRTAGEFPRELQARGCVIVFDGIIANGNVGGAHNQNSFE